MLNLLKSTIHAGLDKPVRLLHVADTHLSLTDERDDDRKRGLAVRRKKAFSDENGSVEKYLDDQIAYSREHCDLLVHAGDLIDFVSEANIDKAGQILSDPGILFIAGNHEYSQYVGEAWEDHAYRMNSYMKIRRRMGVDLLFASRTVGGLNIVALDNGYYQFEDWYLDRLKREVNKGLPVILVLHCPFYEESLYREIMDIRKESSAGLVGCDEEHLTRYEEYRQIQQRSSETTKRVTEYIFHEKRITAILAGHIHFPFESTLPCGKTQYVSGGGFRGEAREITVV